MLHDKAKFNTTMLLTTVIINNIVKKQQEAIITFRSESLLALNT